MESMAAISGSDIVAGVTFVLAIIGTIGGLPVIVKALRPGPSLTILNAMITFQVGKGYETTFFIMNKARFWQRQREASHVKCNFAIIDYLGRVIYSHEDENVATLLASGSRVESSYELPTPPEYTSYQLCDLSAVVDCIEGHSTSIALHRLPLQVVGCAVCGKQPAPIMPLTGQAKGFEFCSEEHLKSWISEHPEQQGSSGRGT